MARRSRSPDINPPANLSPQEMSAAIPKLQRRIGELQEFDVESVDERSDPRVQALEASIDRTIVSIFGTETADYDRYRIAKYLNTSQMYTRHRTPPAEVRQGLTHGIERAIALLGEIVRGFREDLGDIGESQTGRALRAIDGLDLHTEIERAVGKLYRDGHYANAVEDACKALIALVCLRSGRSDLDGTDVMRTVFSVKNPVLAFNDLADRSDQSEQEGMMHLFEGAILAFRNPRAHKLMQDDPEFALEYIAFVSLLAKRLDQATKV